MVLWVGVDDTDSLRGMCTTFLATELVRAFTKQFDLIGYPRLVRLNPNIPWKTRGNGAICLRLGRGRGIPFVIGTFGAEQVVSFPRGESAADPGEVLALASSVLERWAAFDDPTTNPGLVALTRRPPASLYWQAVRDVVPLRAVTRLLRGSGRWKGYKNRRGLIGAAAATAWRPRDRTYELLAYRREALWGTMRRLDPLSVLEMDEALPTTFSNVDPATRRVAIAPHSPCPVLLGVRGNVASALHRAFGMLRGERPGRWLVFETNQGTDDHIVVDDWSLRPRTSTSITGFVAAHPRTLTGGHTIVPFRGRETIDLAFYEPSKDFRSVGRALIPGDRLRVWGSVRRDGRSLNVEKLRVEALAEHRVRIANPVCPECGKSMKSVGHEKGFRCARGHACVPPSSGTWMVKPRSISLGWYEPPAYARRHLSKPLRRIIRSGRDEPSALAPDAYASPVAPYQVPGSAVSAQYS